jgi:hypothetical protein
MYFHKPGKEPKKFPLIDGEYRNFKVYLRDCEFAYNKKLIKTSDEDDDEDFDFDDDDFSMDDDADENEDDESGSKRSSSTNSGSANRKMVKSNT